MALKKRYSKILRALFGFWAIVKPKNCRRISPCLGQGIASAATASGAGGGGGDNDVDVPVGVGMCMHTLEYW